MNIFFAASYVLLASLVVVEGWVLYGVLQEIQRRLELDAHTQRSTAERYREVVSGVYKAKPGRAPGFSARVLESTDVVTNATLMGHKSGFLFVDPACSAVHRPHLLLSIVHALLHKVDSSLFVVCAGTEDTCRALRDQSLLAGLTGGVRIIVDAQRDLARTFGIRDEDPPSAVLIDEHGFTLKSGSMALDALSSA